MRDDLPVTLGLLKRQGKLLEIGCTSCNYHGYVEPDGIRPMLPARFEVASLATLLPCPGCGAFNSDSSQPVWVRTDARPQKVGPSDWDDEASRIVEEDYLHKAEECRRRAQATEAGAMLSERVRQGRNPAERCDISLLGAGRSVDSIAGFRPPDKRVGPLPLYLFFAF